MPQRKLPGRGSQDSQFAGDIGRSAFRNCQLSPDNPRSDFRRRAAKARVSRSVTDIRFLKVDSVLKNSNTGGSKKSQMRGAREIDKRIYRYVEARRSSGTKQVSLF